MIPSLVATPCSTDVEDRPAAEHALQSNTAPWVPAKQGSLATKATAIDGEVTKPGGGIEPPTQDSQNVRMDPSNGDGEVTRPGGGIEPPTSEK